MGTATLIISNEEINDVLKIVKFLKYFGLLIKGISETMKNEAKEKKGGFLGMLLGTLGVSLKLAKERLELAKISDVNSYFN